MGLPAGTRLGPYEIVSPLGAGGMGEVYRARDSKLGRSVAIKVLPFGVARDPEKLDRFQHEAKVLASLNHPNIASIYGFEDSDKPGLVMELVEGPTLADRLLTGPLPVEEALTITKQIGANGGGLRQVTAGEGDDAELDVSSDGKRLVFGTVRLNIGLSQFDTEARAGEANVEVLAADPARKEFGPAYSPDGTHIAFFTNLKGAENESIGVADAKGEDSTQLVRDSRINLFPRWSPDGTHIIYFSEVPDSNKDSQYRSIAISGGAPQTIMAEATSLAADVGRDGRLFYLRKGEAQVFDPRNGKTAALGQLPSNWEYLRSSSDGNSIAYAVMSQQENDPAAGVWITDFKAPPRQVFRGWACAFAVDAHDNIFILKGKADLNGEVWKVKWDGSGLSRVSGILPLVENVNYIHAFVGNQIDVSPDGRYIVFQSQQVLQENIGIIDNVQ